jgi:hypothetical protein
LNPILRILDPDPDPTFELPIDEKKTKSHEELAKFVIFWT